MSYRICSLNVLRSVRGDDKDREFYTFLNNLIVSEGIDIFAFQEAKDINFIRGIRRNLPSYWAGEAVPNSELSFVWNSNRVAESSKAQMAQVFVSYKSDKHLEREPVCARFVPVDFKLNCEIRLINIHIKHGGNDSAKFIDERKEECNLAKGVIYQTVNKSPAGKDGSFRSIFTIVLGDYNLDCDICNQCGDGMVRTFQDGETTLKISEPGYHRSYDHFSYDAESSVPCGEPTSIDAVNRYFYGDFASYRKKISDHIPIKLELY